MGMGGWGMFSMLFVFRLLSGVYGRAAPHANAHCTGWGWIAPARLVCFGQVVLIITFAFPFLCVSPRIQPRHTHARPRSRPRPTRERAARQRHAPRLERAPPPDGAPRRPPRPRLLLPHHHRRRRPRHPEDWAHPRDPGPGRDGVRCRTVGGGQVAPAARAGVAGPGGGGGREGREREKGGERGGRERKEGAFFKPPPVPL